MKKSLLSFVVGAAAGLAAGALMSDEKKEEMQKALGEKAKKFYDEYGDQIKAGAVKVKASADKVKELVKK